MNNLESIPTSTPISYSIEDAVRVSGLGRTTIYGLIGSGKLTSAKIGNRRLIRHADLEALISNAIAA